MSSRGQQLGQKRLARLLALVVLLVGLSISLYGYFGIIRLEGILKDQVDESFPNLGRIHHLLEVVQDTRRLFEHMSDLQTKELEIEIQSQKKKFLDTFLDSQSKRGSFILKSLKGDYFEWTEAGLAFHRKIIGQSSSLDWEKAKEINSRSVELHLKLERYREHLVEGHLEDLEELRSSLSSQYTLLAIVMGVQLTLGMGVFYVLQREGALERSETQLEELMEPNKGTEINEDVALRELKEKDPWWAMVHSDELIFDREKGLVVAGGKENVFLQVVESFMAATPLLLEDLEKAVAEVDRAKIEILIHRLKGSARCVGAERLAAWAQSLERESLEMKPVLLKRAHECLFDNFQAWKMAFEKYSIKTT